jgi:hypothetical protein
MLVPEEFQVSKEQLQWLDFGNTITWRELLMIDYFEHHNDLDYDEGLSFIDRLYNKLPNVRKQWNTIDTIKNLVTTAFSQKEKQDNYLWVIRLVLINKSDVVSYGL